MFQMHINIYNHLNQENPTKSRNPQSNGARHQSELEQVLQIFNPFRFSDLLTIVNSSSKIYDTRPALNILHISIPCQLITRFSVKGSIIHIFSLMSCSVIKLMCWFQCQKETVVLRKSYQLYLFLKCSSPPYLNLWESSCGDIKCCYQLGKAEKADFFFFFFFWGGCHTGSKRYLTVNYRQPCSLSAYRIQTYRIKLKYFDTTRNSSSSK